MPTLKKAVVPPTLTQSFVVVPVSFVVGSAFFSRAAFLAARSSLRGGAVEKRRRRAAVAARASIARWQSSTQVRWRRGCSATVGSLTER